MKKSLLYCILSILNSIAILDASYSRSTSANSIAILDASYLRPTSASINRQQENIASITARAQQQNSNSSPSNSLRKATLQKVNKKFSPKKNISSDSDTNLDLTQSNCEEISQWVEKFNSDKMSIQTDGSDLPAPTFSYSEPKTSPSFKKKQEKMKLLNRKLS